MNPVFPIARRLLRLLAVAALAGAGWAHAADERAANEHATDGYAGIAQLIKEGKPQEALTQLEPRIAANPRDPQLRFLRGVAQTDAGQQAEAVDTFTQLTEQYPELPEPYNNLAVIYASQNLLDKARAALEMAVRVKPDYATAYENLGDIHARLAMQSYERAQQINRAAAVAPKLKLLRELLTPPARPAPAAASH